MKAEADSKVNQWIWVPPGFAHGNVYLEDTHIEYLCTGEYSPNCEAGISPQANINWSLCDPRVYQLIKPFLDNPKLMSAKDLAGYQLEDWIKSPLSGEFIISEKPQILVTGGTGCLGTKLQSMLKAIYPSRSSFDITDYTQMQQYIEGKNIKTILHCGAYTDVPGAAKEPNTVIDTNIIGTANLAKLCNKNNIKLIYISTDYVFQGSTGNYNEESPLKPQNAYAWSKLGGETSVRLCQSFVIIRLSFGHDKFEHPKAFVDQYTSRESVSQIAPKIIKIVKSDFTGVIHLGSTRRSVFQYAKSLSNGDRIGQISIKNVNFNPPIDTSLNTTKFNQLFSNI